jgi:sporulation protein YlmC with PRC-barrel domain
MNLRTITLSAAAAALLATGAIAQNTTTDPAAPPAAVAPKDDAATAPKDGAATTTTVTSTTEAIQFTSSVTPDQMVFSKLKGMDVRNAAGENLGDINDVVVDKSGKPTVAIIGVGGFLGIGEKNVGVPFQALEFTMSNDTNMRVARLDVTKDALTAAPTFVYADEPETAARPVRTQ